MAALFRSLVVAAAATVEAEACYLPRQKLLTESFTVNEEWSGWGGWECTPCTRHDATQHDCTSDLHFHNCWAFARKLQIHQLHHHCCCVLRGDRKTPAIHQITPPNGSSWRSFWRTIFH
uniref:Putative secreted protein n=1 Tax=Anopheles darlingi TaxID=43151 RepID=A0A2M4DLE1_ANODA